MIKWARLALLVSLLSACSTTQVAPEYRVVKIPVAVRCSSAVPTKPDLPFDQQASPSKPLFENVKLLLAQSYSLKAYVAELEAALSACTKQPD